MELTVLSDVEHSEVEAEGANEATDRHDVFVGGSVGTDGPQRLFDEHQICVDIGRSPIAGTVARSVGQTGSDEVDCLAPRLVRIAGDRRCAF